MSRTSWIAIGIACIVTGGVWASQAEKDIYHGNQDSRLDSLAAIQPGLGVVMHEIGYRFDAAYFAANGGNWGLAQYELKELLEAQEVGELTRPNRAAMLQAFEQSHLDPLVKSVENKDIAQFNKQYSSTVTACNACHTALGYGYIHYQMPSKASSPVLDYKLKTDPAAAK